MKKFFNGVGNYMDWVEDQGVLAVLCTAFVCTFILFMSIILFIMIVVEVLTLIPNGLYLLLLFPFAVLVYVLSLYLSYRRDTERHEE